MRPGRLELPSRPLDYLDASGGASVTTAVPTPGQPVRRGRHIDLRSAELTLMSGETGRDGRASPGSPSDDFPAASGSWRRSIVWEHPAFVTPVESGGHQDRSLTDLSWMCSW